MEIKLRAQRILNGGVVEQDISTTIVIGDPSGIQFRCESETLEIVIDGQAISIQEIQNLLKEKTFDIPPELLQPAFVPQKPETFTNDEWLALTNDQRIACNVLIQDAIEYDKDGWATNLQCYNDDSENYSEAYTYSDINHYQYRIEPALVYKPFEKPASWMIGKVVRSRFSSNESIITGRCGIYVYVDGVAYTMEDMFEDTDFLDVATGETKPFGKVKGE